MLKRHRVLLALIDSFENGLSRDEFIRTLSLLASQSELNEESSFYDFIIVDNVLYSFTASHDIDKLIERGLIGSENGNALFLDSRHSRSEDLLLDDKYITAIKRTLYWIRNNKSNIMTSRSSNSTSHSNGKYIYTAGYEGYSIESYIELLLEHNIECILDVRKNPISRKYGFSKRALTNVCNTIGLEYVHKPAFGINSEHRRDLQTKEDYIALIQEYATSTLPHLQNEIKEASNIAGNHSCVLLCYEADPDTCHRKPLAKSLSRETGQMVVHL